MTGGNWRNEDGVLLHPFSCPMTEGSSSHIGDRAKQGPTMRQLGQMGTYVASLLGAESPSKSGETLQDDTGR